MREFFESEKVDICRWGGEEILLTVYDIPFEEAYDKIEQLRKTISEYDFCYENVTSKVTMTFGMYQRNAEEKVIDLIEKADRLLYKGKTKGKNVVVKKELSR